MTASLIRRKVSLMRRFQRPARSAKLSDHLLRPEALFTPRHVRSGDPGPKAAKPDMSV